MKKLVILICLGLGACGGTKSVSPPPAASSSDPNAEYLQVFYDGLQLKGREQFQDAIVAFSRALELKPTDDAAAYAIAQCYLAMNDNQRAAEFSLKASKLDPENVWYTQEVAYMFYDQQKFGDAEKAFQKLVSRQPENLDWQFGLAEVYKNQGKRKEAIQAYDKMEGIIGVMPDISLRKYELYRQLGDDRKALEELANARKVYPDELMILGTYVDYYFEKNDISGARKMLEELVAANPDNGRANLTLAEIYLRDNRLPEALPVLEKAFESPDVDIDTKMQILLKIYDSQVVISPEVLHLGQTLSATYPQDPKPYSVLGDFYLKNNDEANALVMYKKALEFEQSKYPIWNQVLLLEYKQGRFEDLYKDSRLAAALFPNVVSVQLFYTIAGVQTRRFQEAVDAADMGLSILLNDQNTEAEFFAQRGEALVRLGQTSEGFENFDRAIGLSPDNLLIKNNYAILLAVVGQDLGKAMRMIEDVLVKVSPGASALPAFLDTKAIILLQGNKPTEAREVLERAHGLNSTDGNIQEHLGDAEFKLGNHAKALEWWEKAKASGARSTTLETKIKTKKYHVPQL